MKIPLVTQKQWRALLTHRMEKIHSILDAHFKEKTILKTCNIVPDWWDKKNASKMIVDFPLLKFRLLQHLKILDINPVLPLQLAYNIYHIAQQSKAPTGSSVSAYLNSKALFEKAWRSSSAPYPHFDQYVKTCGITL